MKKKFVHESSYIVDNVTIGKGTESGISFTSKLEQL